MGRKKIRTDEERRELNKKCRMKYYWKHVKEERKKSLKRYYDKKNKQ